MSRNDSPTNRPTGSYLDELMKELRTMANIYQTNHSVSFRNAHKLLVREIQRVWEAEMMNRSAPSLVSEHERIPAGSEANSSSPHVEFSTIGRLLRDGSPEERRRHSFSPMTYKMKTSSTVLSPAAKSEDGGNFEKTEKLFFPEDTAENSNPIGRLIGPRGMTIRQLEKDLSCKLYIRGKGCTKDDAKESRLRGRSGWDHLDEPIHVLISVRGDSEQKCSEKLSVIKPRLQEFLEHTDSDLKRSQLMQLALIEGTLKS
ncbi:unnamed protein product [Caenorhabditis sp. 36 PRJEB53466]|nr:unnamed protein product [Caenorhabditis sp. 36 PRJEB53466]